MAESRCEKAMRGGVRAARIGFAVCLLGFALSLRAEAEPARFVDVAASAGVAFRHVHGGTGKKYFVETMGSGCAMLDYDNDGWMDLFAVNGGALPGYAGERPLHGLYRNRGDGTFEDVTERAGVGRTDYGMGCCAGDYDNDGYDDLYVTCYGRNALFRNQGDGTFTDVGRQAGVAGDSTWSTGCTFLDYDRDGYLDLYVARYVAYALSDSEREMAPYATGMGKEVFRAKDERAYPHPIHFRGLPGTLYRNLGGGTFEEVGGQAGVSGRPGKGLGGIALDYDDDGDSDLYVCNDMMSNFLFRNEGGKFEEVALFSGAGHNEVGGVQASMGVDAGDYDGDGRQDLAVTNFQEEGTTLYHNDGGGFFTDVSLPSGVRRSSFERVGWGVAFVDCDNDGWPDLFSVHGHVLDNVDRFVNGATYPQRRHLLRNARNGAFEDVSATAGPGLDPQAVGRGAAFGDFDNDGDVDVFVNNNNSPAALLRNDGSTGFTTGGGNRNRWLLVKLVGGMRKETADGRPHPPPPHNLSLPLRSRPHPSLPLPLGEGGGNKGLSPKMGEGEASFRLSNRDGIGARVTVWAGGRGQAREVRSGSSYLSQNDLRLHFGLEAAKEVDSVVVRWPGGLVQRTGRLPSSGLLLVREGEGYEVKPGTGE